MIFSGIYARGTAQPELSDEAFVQAMLDVEVALARSLVRCDLASASEADAIAEACRDASAYDIAAIGASIAETGTPVPGLLAAVRAQLSDEAGATLHRGATSQDIIDTAMMLVARRSLWPIMVDLTAAGRACAELALAHRDTVMAGRTLLQQGAPITFGLKAALWLDALHAARFGLSGVRDNTLAIQLGGAVGTLAVLGDRGLDVAAALADQLELAEPRTPWHTIRLRPARLASALGSTLGVMAKVARDLVLLAQTEVGEATERSADGRGGSSTMPHKRNPVGSIVVLGCAQQAPGLVAAVLAAMAQEHERAAGAWQGEWAPMLELLRLTASAAAALRESLELIEVHPERMRENLDELVMSESVVAALGGDGAAKACVEAAVNTSLRDGRPLREGLLAQPVVVERLGEDGLDRALDPAQYLGVAGRLIDRALEAYGYLEEEEDGS